MLRVNSYQLKSGLIITLLALLLSLFFITRIAAAAQNMQTGDNIVVQKDEVINKDFFAGGDSVTIEGTINGDAYIGAGKIIIDGTVNGDLIAGGGDITVNGNVTQNIRMAGGNITINGKVGRNATVMGGNINFTNSSQISGSLVSGGGNIDIYALVGKDIYLGGGSVTIGNKVGGDINAGAGDLTLLTGSSVAGNLNYLSDKNATILPGASVSGQLIHNLPPKHKEDTQKNAKDAMMAFGIFWKFINLTSLFILGLLFIRFLPKFSAQTAEIFGSDFWTVLVVGILAMIVTPIAVIILMITVLGIPLALILLFGYSLALFLSKIFVLIWLGNFIGGKTNQKWNQYLSFIVGIIALTLLSFVPILGAIVSIIVTITGLGALLISKKNFYLKIKGDL